MKTDLSQGEALGAWAVWGAVTLAVLITYSRLDATELYNVSHEGLAGGLGRALVLLNFPVPSSPFPWLCWPSPPCHPRHGWSQDPRSASAQWCRSRSTRTTWTRAGSMRSRRSASSWLSGLTIAAARRAGRSFAPRRTGDPLRLVVAAVVVVLSVGGRRAPFSSSRRHLPREELYLEEDGRRFAAVHLGHHHGGDGAVLVLTALLLSRVRLRPGACGWW